MTVKPAKVYGSSILRVASHFSAVASDCKILSLAEMFQEQPELAAVAVLDSGQNCIGLVSRGNLFNLLGKPFGRDILNKKLVQEITEDAPSFNAHANLFAVADEVRQGSKSESPRYFLLVDTQHKFMGIFSSHDLVRYLSQITQEDIELAAMLQERLVREHERVAGKGWKLNAWSHYAKGVGGDFYSHRSLAGGKEFITLCDVSGKGVAASIISSMVWGMLRMFDFRRGLRELVTVLNESLITSFQLEKYLTGIFLIYDATTRKLLSADMGHSHALIIRKSKVMPLRGPRQNMPLGIDPAIDPQLYTFSLEVGDTILIYTDGITEQENAAGEEFSEQGLVSSIKDCIAEQLDPIEYVPKLIRDFKGSTPQQDDMSFILLSINS